MRALDRHDPESAYDPPFDPKFHPMMHEHTDLCSIPGGCDIVEHGLEGWGRHEEIHWSDLQRYNVSRKDYSMVKRWDIETALSFRSLVVAPGMYVQLKGWFGDVWAEVERCFRWDTRCGFHPEYDSVSYRGREGRRVSTQMSEVRCFAVKLPKHGRIFASTSKKQNKI